MLVALFSKTAPKVMAQKRNIMHISIRDAYGADDRISGYNQCACLSLEARDGGTVPSTRSKGLSTAHEPT